MATDHGGIDIAFTTTGAVGQYYAVIGSAGSGRTVSAGASAASLVIGIAQEAATASGDEINVRVSGTSKLKLGGTVNMGGAITCGAAGVGVASSFTTNDLVFAYALDYGVSGDIIEVVLNSMTQAA